MLLFLKQVPKPTPEITKTLEAISKRLGFRSIAAAVLAVSKKPPDSTLVLQDEPPPTSDAIAPRQQSEHPRQARPARKPKDDLSQRSRPPSEAKVETEAEKIVHHNFLRKGDREKHSNTLSGAVSMHGIFYNWDALVF